MNDTLRAIVDTLEKGYEKCIKHLDYADAVWKAKEFINKSISHRDLARLSFDESFRLCKIIHLASMTADSETLPPMVEDVFEMDFEEIYEATGIKKRCKEIKMQAPSLEKPDFEDFCQCLYKADIQGFLVQVETPVPHNMESVTDYSSYGWGYRTQAWVYGETMPEAIEAAIAWKKKYIAKQFKRQGKKK